VKIKKKKLQSYFSNIGACEVKKESKDVCEDLAKTGLKYIQMKLPFDNITSQLENELKEKIKSHINDAEVRKAKRDDLRSILKIYNRAWMTSNTPFSPLEYKTLKEIYNLPEAIILIAKLYNKDVGFIIIDFEKNENKYAIIAGIGVLPRYQNKGVGKLLALEAWKKLRKMKIKGIKCEVYEKNKSALNFIRSIGFEEYKKITYRMDDFQPIN
jgi:ribosomal protein S18 acetylase RimI-like enzyme